MSTIHYLISLTVLIHLIMPYMWYIISPIQTHPIRTYVSYGLQTWGALVTTLILRDQTVGTLYEPVYDFFTELYKGICFIVLFDIWFYTVHRLCHEIPSVYKHIHKVHHLQVNPTSLDALIVDPIEGIIIADLPGICLVHMLNMHIATHIVMMIVSHFIVFVSHSGHDTHHLAHHHMFSYNYGATPFTDLLFGTYYRGKLNRKYSNPD